MKILILSSIALALLSCGKNPPQDNWPAPALYFLTANKNKVLTKNDSIGLNDYVYFSNESSELQKDIPSEYSIRAESNCVVRGKSFNSSNNIYSKSHVQLKEFLPTQATLNKDDITCKMHFVLSNSAGSTKSYYVSEKNVELNSFKGDFSHSESVNYQDFKSQKISLPANDASFLVCEEFSIDSKGVTNFSELFENHIEMKEDINVKQYKPRTYCRWVMKIKNTQRFSNIFEIRFEKLLPQYSHKIYSGRTAKRAGDKLYLYDLNLSNPHEVPISFALNKNSLAVPLTNSRSRGSREVDGGYTYSHYTGKAVIKNNKSESVIDKNNVFVIHLLPGESISFNVHNISGCKGNICDHSNIQPKHLPIYNLEYNYRTIEEINQTTEVKLLDQMSAN